MRAMQSKKPLFMNILDILRRYTDEDADGVAVTAALNKMAAERFAKGFAPDVVVLEPEGSRR